MSGASGWVQDSRLRELVTTLGSEARGELGLILPHEHIFLDLRTWESLGHGAAESEEVVRRVAPIPAESPKRTLLLVLMRSLLDYLRQDRQWQGPFRARN